MRDVQRDYMSEGDRNRILESEGNMPMEIAPLVVVFESCGLEESRSAFCLFFTLTTVSLNLSSSSDRTMIDVSQFKQAPPHMMGLLCGRHLPPRNNFMVLCL